MTSNALVQATHYAQPWRMPLVPQDYDCHPLTKEEEQALITCSTKGPATREAYAARDTLARLACPIADVFELRRGERSKIVLCEVQSFFRHQMLHYGKTFWEWSQEEWFDTICPTATAFHQRYGKCSITHITLLDAAYLLGGMTDLRPVGIGQEVSEAAWTYFGRELMTQQCHRILHLLTGENGAGYGDGKTSQRKLLQCLSMLFLLNRSPYLEELSEDLLVSVAAMSDVMRWSSEKVALALRSLHILSSSFPEVFAPTPTFESEGMAEEWYGWCMAWYQQSVDLSPAIRQKYAWNILATGRWLSEKFPEIRCPEQWTEELAWHYRSDLCHWTAGQYAGSWGRYILGNKEQLGLPLGASSLRGHLVALRRYLSDLVRKPHAVDGKPARRITLDFAPKEVLTLPTHLQQILNGAEPRDIDLRTWAKLTIAAATLAPGDLPQRANYPLSFYRAMALIWVTSARRPNEITRLRLNCVRQDWEPAMLGEGTHSQEESMLMGAEKSNPTGEAEQEPLKLCYLHIPSGKYRGPFWIWIPDYVADAIRIWQEERPPNQHKLLDRKDREYVDYLFSTRNQKVGEDFLNLSLIPVLCTKAGVVMADAKGRITGHRGRSTRLTLLRNKGVGLDDLAEYAGHADSRTIRRYARQNPLQLHRIIQDADEISRILEGVVDVQAAAKGIPALRWFIGYDADGEPQYCANQVYHTCPHRLDCIHCGMSIGGEKARLLHEGEDVLPITSKVPMTPVEKCIVNGDQSGAQACRAVLRELPAPETPSSTLLFNPGGLSDAELQKLADQGTDEALSILRQALEATQRQFAENDPSKTGRNALVRAQKKRMSMLKAFIANSEGRLSGQLHQEEQEPR
jgi:integrase